MVAILIQSPPIDRPLVKDTKNEIAKDTFHEEDLRQCLQPDKHLLAIVDMVENVEDNGKGHLKRDPVSEIFRKYDSVVVLHESHQ